MRFAPLPLFLLLAAATALPACGRTNIRVGRDGEVSTPDGGRPDAARPDGGGCTSSASCDDGLFCNGAEQCIRGACVAGPAPSCEDFVPCTRDFCDAMRSACVSIPDSTLCADGTICDPAAGGCVVVPCMGDGECDDGIACNGAERCIGGSCRPSMPLFCDDADECTDDACSEAAGGCVHAARDADGDGFTDAACGGTDCDDTTPFVSPGSPEDCGNGLDDDCDGALDCGDDTCAGRPECRCGAVEICGNGMDDECDGATDCDDTECAATPACMMTCDTRELGSAVGERVAFGTTVGQPNRVTPTCASSTAPDVTFRWTAPSAGLWSFDTRTSSYDTMLVVQSACDGPALACNDDTPGVGTVSTVTLMLAAGQTVLIVVDGFGGGAGNFVLNIRMGAAVPENCFNRVDDDGDGLVDCADSDCTGSPSCCMPSPEVCTNGTDDDCDRRIDCVDFDCRTSPACCTPRVEVCNDRTDQDCDALIDCADPDCASSTFCCRPTPETCTGGRDEDCDGRIDCTDSDCTGSPSCCVPAPENCSNGIDDDCDTRVDCADPVCATAPACCMPSPELCANGRDDDCDARIDCADTDCDLSPSCCVPVPETCGNMEDDDCDARTDCADPDCAASPLCCVPSPEVCTGGRDEDCDRRVDCGDTDCASAPACCVPAPEVCDNMRDDDCDALTDCADPVCATAPACCVPAMESCSNGTDDDCDARVDCADTDCAMIPPCAPACPDRDLGSRTGRAVATGTTVGAPNRFTPSCNRTSTAGERVFSWTAPADGDYVFDTSGSTYDTVMTIRATCTGPELACDDDMAGAQDSLIRRNGLRAGDRLIIAVDGFGAGTGPFILNITQIFPSEAGRCANGLDDDADRAIDCGDSDCFMDMACVMP